jgi:oxygen-dependent protoporphyrinogen oxidase
MSTVAIIGAGVAGLSVAHEIRKRAPHVGLIVLEPRERTGGNVRTEICDGYTCEWGAVGFLDNAPATLQLVREVGLEPRLLPSRDSARRRYIYRSGRLHEVPASPLAFLTSSLLSARAKARLLGEPFASGPGDDPDESIASFAARRIGAEAAAVMVDSMVSGIYAGDASALSLRACFPRMREMEQEHGSLFRALLATRKRRKKGDAIGAPAGRLTSFYRGMTELVEGLTRSLGPIVRTSSPVVDLQPPATSGGFRIATPDRRISADAVVLAGPAAGSADLLRGFGLDVSAALRAIPTAPLAVVCLGYDEAQLTAERGPLDGFGFLVPRSEKIRTLGALWETSIFDGRGPTGKALMRVMIGGAHDPHVLDSSDDELLAIVRDDLRQTMSLRIEPEMVRIFRHPRGIPQYTIGHLRRLARIDAELDRYPGLFVAGNSYRGVAINACIAEAGAIADKAITAAARASSKPAA